MIEDERVHIDGNKDWKENMPHVLRNSCGRICWSVPGQTTEENLLLGIRNVQGLFLERFPDFNIQFPGGIDGRIQEDKLEAAKQFIIQQLDTKQKRHEVLGKSITSRQSAPYFEGSYAIAIRKSFIPWGIVIDTTRGDKGRSRLMGRPVTIDGENWVTVGLLHDKYHADYRTIYKCLEGVAQRIGMGRNGRNATFYSEREALARIDKYISRAELPRADKKSDDIIVKAGERWVSARFLRSLSAVSSEDWEKLIQDVPSMTGLYSNGLETIFYSESEAMKLLENYQKLPIIDEQLGVYRDGQEGDWAPQAYFLQQTNNKYDVIKCLKQGKPLKGRLVNGRQTNLYSVSEVRQKLAQQDVLPRINQDSEKYVDQDDNGWVTLDYAVRLIGYSVKNKAQIMACGISTLKGRGQNGKETDLYNEQEIRERFKDFIGLPTVEKESGAYLDSEEQRWVTSNLVEDALGFGRTTLAPYLEGVPTIAGRGINGQRVILYKESDVYHNLNSLLSLPRVDRQTGVYIDNDGVRWISVTSFCKEASLDTKFAAKRLEGISSILGRSRVNVRVTLYNEAELLKVLSVRERQPRGYWTIEKVEKEISKFYQEYGDLSYRLLSEHDRGDLAGAIGQIYPGGMRKAQEKLGIQSTRKPDRYWYNITNIDVEIDKALKAGIPLNGTALREAGLKTLAYAIYKIYPGGMKAAQEKFGLIKSSESPLSSEEANADLERLFEII